MFRIRKKPAQKTVPVLLLKMAENLLKF